MAFHVACPYTCLAVCRCTQGTPSVLRDPKANARHRRQAKMLWEFWKDPEKLLMPKEDVQLSLPPLDRRKIFEEERRIRRQLDDMMPAEDEGDTETRLPSLPKAKQKLQRTEREATTYCSRALRAAQEAGVSWNVPEDAGIHVPLPPPLPDATPQPVEGKEKEQQKPQAQVEEVPAAVVSSPREHGVGRKEDAPAPNQVEGKPELREDLPVYSNQPEVPDKSLMLKLKDIRKNLVGKQLLLFWPDEGAWYRVEVLEVNARKRIAMVLYETGESEELELEDIVKNQEIAWNSEAGIPADVAEEGAAEDPVEEAPECVAMPRIEQEEGTGADYDKRASRRPRNDARAEKQEEPAQPIKKGRKRTIQKEGKVQGASETERLPSVPHPTGETARKPGRKRKHQQVQEQAVTEQEMEATRSLKKIKIKMPTRGPLKRTRSRT